MHDHFYDKHSVLYTNIWRASTVHQLFWRIWKMASVNNWVFEGGLIVMCKRLMLIWIQGRFIVWHTSGCQRQRRGASPQSGACCMQSLLLFYVYKRTDWISTGQSDSVSDRRLNTCSPCRLHVHIGDTSRWGQCAGLMTSNIHVSIVTVHCYLWKARQSVLYLWSCPVL